MCRTTGSITPQRPIRPFLSLAALIGLCLSGAALPAAAASYCVACFEPDAVYRCMVEGQSEATPADPRHQIQCIKELARAGGHARCSVERFSTAGCDGPIKVIDPGRIDAPAPRPADAGNPDGAGQAPEAAAGPTEAGTGDPQEGPEEAKPAKPTGPPRTVEELAKTTAESTKKGLEGVGQTVKEQTKKAGEQIEGAGSALGNAAKKTWDCLTSFFGDC